MSAKRVLVVGAGPCGLVGLKELREAGHDAMSVDKGPDVGGLFCPANDAQYGTLYLTISNFFMAFSDFPPPEMEVRYSSKAEYSAYLEAYADHFGLRPHIRFRTEVTRARPEGSGWRVTLQTEGQAPEELVVDALVVATGSNHHPRRIELPGYTGRVLHSSEYRDPEAFRGQRVLVIGAGESAADIAADVGAVAAETTVWSRSPLHLAPRFPVRVSLPAHDELALMRSQAKPGRFQVSDFLEVMTTSRMANQASMATYSMVRHAIYFAMRGTWKQGRLLSAWNRGAMALHPVLGDQVAVPTKSARLVTLVANGEVRAIVAKKATFDGMSVTFDEIVRQEAGSWKKMAKAPVRLDQVDVVIECTGYRTNFSWLEAPGLDWSPRTWFKHSFPPGWGDRLMFLGWARPHQGGIPACAEMLARFIAMQLAGTRSLPADYAERARIEGEREDEFFLYAKHSPNLVDYFAFMDSVSRMVGCYPNPPPWYRLARRTQYWMYPNWSVWYRMEGPGARPDVVERVMKALPLGWSYLPNPFILLALFFSLVQLPVDAVLRPRTGLGKGWQVKPKKYLLHGNEDGSALPT